MKRKRPSSLPIARWRGALAALVAGIGLLSASPVRAQGGAVVPPTVVSHVDAVYPPSALADRKHGDVVLAVTVDVDGHVSKVDVLESGGAALDEAATIAARQWTFVPAKRDGEPVASRIRVPFHFAPPAPPPELVVTPPPASPSSRRSPPSRQAPRRRRLTPLPLSAPGAATRSPSTAPSPPISRRLGLPHRRRRPPRRPAHRTPPTTLKLAPGILLTNEGGEGHAEQVFLRGFDAREGQDVEFSVDGVPSTRAATFTATATPTRTSSSPSSSSRFASSEGPFIRYQGNYAVAGSADYDLGLEKRGVDREAHVRQLEHAAAACCSGARRASRADTFGGAEIVPTDGFGRIARRSAALPWASTRSTWAPGRLLRVGGQAYSTHYQTAGVIREDDYEAGRVSFYGTEDPLQGGDSSRVSLYATLREGRGRLGFEQSLFLIRRDMRLREDFTGFLLDTQERARHAPRTARRSHRHELRRVDDRGPRARPVVHEGRGASSSPSTSGTSRASI